MTSRTVERCISSSLFNHSSTWRGAQIVNCFQLKFSRLKYFNYPRQKGLQFKQRRLSTTSNGVNSSHEGNCRCCPQVRARVGISKTGVITPKHENPFRTVFDPWSLGLRIFSANTGEPTEQQIHIVDSPARRVGMFA